MKKLYLTIYFLFTFSAFVVSQNVRFGVIGSGNILALSGPDKPNSYEKQYGFSGGAFIDTRVTEYMSSQVEINFTRYNFQFSQDIEHIDNAYFNIKEQNDYITIPIKLKYKRGYEVAFYYLSAGVQTSILINNKRDVVAMSRDLEIDATTYYNYKHNWYDYGVNFGAGFQFKPVTIGISYYYSMRNLYTNKDAWEMRYKALSLEMSWQFNYRNRYPYGRKAGWKGFKYKIKNLF